MSDKHWKHDCDACVHLGSHEEDERMYDLYVCTNDNETELVARFGDDGGDYRSSSAYYLFHGKVAPIYLEIGKRARKSGIEMRPF